MTEYPLDEHRLTNPHDDDADQYRPVCGQALAALGLGLFAPLALLSPVFWLVPPLAILLALWALWRIRSETPTLVGRKAALAGLWLALIFAAAAPAEWATYRWYVRREAREFALHWFDLLRRREPQKAHQLTIAPQGRLPLDAKLWNEYAAQREMLDGLRSYVGEPAVAALLALQDRAQVRFYQDGAQWHEDNREAAEEYFAVTYTDQGAKKTFFVRLTLVRSRLEKPNRADWHITNAQGGARPPALGGEIQPARG